MGEGTSIDFEEPVVITIQCDSDGWVMQVDKLLYITLNFDHKVDVYKGRPDICHFFSTNVLLGSIFLHMKIA